MCTGFFACLDCESFLRLQAAGYVRVMDEPKPRPVLPDVEAKVDFDLVSRPANAQLTLSKTEILAVLQRLSQSDPAAWGRQYPDVQTFLDGIGFSSVDDFAARADDRDYTFALDHSMYQAVGFALEPSFSSQFFAHANPDVESVLEKLREAAPYPGWSDWYPDTPGMF